VPTVQENMDLKALKEWFNEEKRDLPWRKKPSPYAVWISEIMLQQTLSAVVSAYFEKWMQTFPTLESLALASLDEVMKAWEGLGYYSRARNLHTSAQIILEQFGGELPSKREELEKLKGFGPYTVGAVLSFAFHQRAAAVDGNVIRVISRLLSVWEDASRKKIFEDHVLSILPEDEPWVLMEALIELGAQICQKKPKCDLCPLQEKCLAYKEGSTSLLPIKKKPAKMIRLSRDVAVVIYKKELLLRKEELGKVMGGLYEFPYVPKGSSWDFDLPLKEIKVLPKVKHGFTKFSAELYPTVYRIEEKKNVDGYEWINIEEIEKLPFSSGHRRILKEVMREDFIYRKL
jgi:A/G-specific adenine glycosylase